MKYLYKETDDNVKYYFTDLKDFLNEHNKFFETNYNTIEDFNNCEEYRKIKTITMTKEKQQRNELIDFIINFASDEIETINDALKLARMTNQELKEDIKSIKEYYKREHKTII